MRYAKKVFDPLHGFIHLSESEEALLKTAPLDRLRYIHQLGLTYLVYPGATHKRFEHSLGVMHLSSLIYDGILKNIPVKEDFDYWRRTLRFAALVHDVGHLPFSHAAEEALLGVKGHEEWTKKIVESSYLKGIWEGEGMARDILKLATGEGIETPWERMLCEIITGDFFGADRIDYLLRDARCTGVSYGLLDYHQLIEMIRVLPGEELRLGIEENGLESCEALLLARHFMHRRVYSYHSVKAYNHHLASFMRRRYRFDSVEAFVSLADHHVLTDLFAAKDDPDALAILGGGERVKFPKTPFEALLELRCPILKGDGTVEERGA